MVLVYGGSFNPPSKAHELILSQLIETYNPNKVIIVPVGDAYGWKHNLTSFFHRYNMVNLMLGSYKNVEISSLENSLEFKGTFQTLNELSQTYEDIYFVLGTDHLETLTKWIDYEKLLKTYGFIIINRSDYKLDVSLFEKYHTKYHVMQFDSIISSSRIRLNVEMNKNDLNPHVYQYIKKNHLYQEAKK